MPVIWFQVCSIDWMCSSFGYVSSLETWWHAFKNGKNKLSSFSCFYFYYFAFFLPSENSWSFKENWWSSFLHRDRWVFVISFRRTSNWKIPWERCTYSVGHSSRQDRFHHHSGTTSSDDTKSETGAVVDEIDNFHLGPLCVQLEKKKKSRFHRLIFAIKIY